MQRLARPRRLLRPLAMAALGLALAMPLVGAIGTAAAQERPRTLFEFLFGGRRDEARRPEVRSAPTMVKPKATRRATAPRRESAAAPAEPEVTAVDKAADARVVLVVGDFLAGGVAEGLATAFAEDTQVKVVERTNGSSGLVRDDFYDWPGEIGAILDAEKPAVAVVMMGSNDRQQMRVGDARENVRSEKWNAEYSARATAVATAFAERNIPFVWIGLPSFKFPKMSSDMLAFNDLQRGAVEAAGGTFVDIWEGFVDENGAFVANGPDINGQPVRLRAGDGINFTQAGKRKMAFYAEKPLNRILDSDTRDEAPEAGTPLLPGTPDAAVRPVDRTPPISLFDPDIDGGSELLGLVVEPNGGAAQTAAERLTIEGVAPEPMPGRVDDFSGRKPPAVVRPAPPERERTSAIGP